MDAEDLSTLISILNDRSYIGSSFGQDIRHLRNGSRKERGNSFLRDVGSPVSQSFRISIIGVKSIGTMGVNINKTRKNTIVSPVFITFDGAPWQNIHNFLIFHLNLCRNKLTGNPDMFTL